MPGGSGSRRGARSRAPPARQPGRAIMISCRPRSSPAGGSRPRRELLRTLVMNALRLAGRRAGVGRQLEYLVTQWSRMELPFDRLILMSPREIRMTGLGDRTPVET